MDVDGELFSSDHQCNFANAWMSPLLLTCVVLSLCAVCVLFARQGLALLSAVAPAAALTQGELRAMHESTEKAQHLQQHRGRHPAIPPVFLILQLQACSCMLIHAHACSLLRSWNVGPRRTSLIVFLSFPSAFRLA